MRTPKPWFRSQNDTWYVCFHGKQIPLAKGKRSKREAEDAFHELMASGLGGPLPTPEKAATRLKVAAVLDQFFDWVRRNLDCYEWHRHFLQQFAMR